MAIVKTQKINWCPLSEKHIKYIQKALRSWFSVAEGAVRSGKTVDNCIIAATILEVSPDKIHLASGSTIANAKMNIGDCNGFGLEHLFRGRCRWGNYKQNEALYIQTQTGEKIVIFAGGAKRDSYKKILGNSYGLWIATEINEHYDGDNPKESFIKVAFDRQIAAIKPKVLWDLNPDNPFSQIYTEYIDKYLKEGLVGGYNYQHFTIYDNSSVSEQRRKEIESRYGDKNSVYYRRNILGQRCIAEGLCYKTFAKNPKAYYVDDDWLKEHTIFKINCGVDFGGDSSATTFVATAYVDGYDYLVPLKAVRIKSEIDSEELQEEFRQFCIDIYNKYYQPFETYCDSAESVLIHTLDTLALRENLQTTIRYALKEEIKERVRFLNSMIAAGKFKILMNNGINECQEIENALVSASWDSSKKEQGDIRLDVVSFENPIDIMDALEYSFERDMNKFIIY